MAQIGKKAKPHPNDIIDTEKLFLKIGGIYPLDAPNVISYIAFIVTLFMSFGLFFAMGIQLFIEKEMAKIINILYYLPQQTAYVFKLINFLYNGKTIHKIQIIFNSSLFNLHKEQQYHFLNDAIYKTKIIGNIFRMLCCGVVAFYGMQPLYSNDPMPLPAWYPFDINKYSVVIYFFEVLGVLVSATINSNIDLLNVRLISLGTAQLEILTDNLENVADTEEMRRMSEQEINNIVEERVQIYAQHHQLILEYMMHVENTFTYGIFGQFVLSMVVICMTGFNMIMVSVQSWDFLLLIIFFSCMTNQVYIYCWYGNEILVKSTSITQSCYITQWYNCSPKVCKLLWIMMERTKRPIKLTAGYFFTLSLATFMSVVRSSYSYFAVLQRMYAKSDE